MNEEQYARLQWFTDKKKLPESTLFNKHKLTQNHDLEKYVKKIYLEGIELSDFEFEENIEAIKGS